MRLPPYTRYIVSNLMSMAAHWARVAVPRGASVVSVTPVIMPFSTAQAIASTAQALTPAPSV